MTNRELTMYRRLSNGNLIHYWVPANKGSSILNVNPKTYRAYLRTMYDIKSTRQLLVNLEQLKVLLGLKLYCQLHQGGTHDEYKLSYKQGGHEKIMHYMGINLFDLLKEAIEPHLDSIYGSPDFTH